MARLFGVLPQVIRQTWTWETLWLEHDNAKHYDRVQRRQSRRTPDNVKPQTITIEQFMAQFGTSG